MVGRGKKYLIFWQVIALRYAIGILYRFDFDFCCMTIVGGNEIQISVKFMNLRDW